MLAACTVAPWVDPDHALRELLWTAEGKSCSASYVAPRSDFGDTHTKIGFSLSEAAAVPAQVNPASSVAR